MVDLLEQLCMAGGATLFPGNGERALLLMIIIRKGIVRILVQKYIAIIKYITLQLLSVVGKVFCNILNNSYRLVQCLDNYYNGVLHEGLNILCMDYVYTLNEIVHGS